MTKEHDLLAAITSRDQLETVRRKHSLLIPSVSDYVPQLSSGMYQATGLDTCLDNDTLWPLQRDVLREAQGAYPPPTEVVRWMRTFKHVHQHFPHVSREDPLMVAYTPDVEAGVRDKKVRIAIGRFVRKFFPLLTDNAVRQLEAAHRAELDPTLEIVTGFDEVARVYKGMSGDSGCMRYDMSHFGHDEYHPSAIYASPNFGVAVHRAANGTVKSRAVVWESPEDPEDKRYVRIYGDNALERKLQRKGFKLRGLKGAKVLALRDESWANDESEQDRFIMPYIDPAGGIHYNGSKDSKYDARFAVRYDDDPDFLHLVTNDERNKLNALGVSTVSCDSQSGSIRVPLSTRAEVMVICAITRKRFSRMEHHAVQWMNEDGTLGWAKTDAIGQGHEQRQTGLPSGRMLQVYGLPQTFEGKCLPGAWGHMLDNEHTMRINRLVRLDPAHYPEEDQSIYAMRECVQVGDSWIKQVDAYQVQEAGEGGGFVTRHIHKDAVRMLRKMGYVNTHPVSGMKLLVHSTDSRLVLTAGEKKALKGVHELVALWDGQWEFTRNTESIYIGGFTVLVKKGSAEHRKDAVVSDSLIRMRIFDYVGDHATLAEYSAQRQFLRYFGRFLHKTGDRIEDASYGSNAVTCESVINAARSIVGMESQQAIDGLHYSNVTLGWARSVVRAVQISEENRIKGIEMAEANALLYEVDQSEDEFNPAQRSAEDELLNELDRVLAVPATTFIRPSGSMSNFQQQYLTSAVTLNPVAALPTGVVAIPVSQLVPADDDLTF